MIKIFDKLVFGQNEDKLKKLTIKEVIYDFENKKNKNLFFLIEKRFEWMKRFINENEKGLEVGAGAGFSKVILNSYKIDTCDYSTLEIKKRLNFNIKKITLKDLFDQSKRTNKKIISLTKKKISKDLTNTINLNQKEFNKSISIYHGLNALQSKHNLQAFAIRCWPEMFTEYGCASCGPMAMMNEKKISCACEADILGGISCNILNQLNNKPSLLVDIVDINGDDNSVVFWHCGLAPISMSKKGKARADIHSNRKKPLLHNFAFKPGLITIFRVSKSANKLKFFVLKGKIIDRKNSFSGTSGVVSFGKDTKGKMEKMFKGGLEHHVAFTYGNYYNEIIKLGNQMKIPTYTV